LKETSVLSIKELTFQIKRCIEGNPAFQDVWARGEISNFIHHSRGHMYLTLKDDTSKIKAVMFAGNNRYLKFIPKNGLKVLVRGEVSLYERDGQYQFYIKEMQPDGIGALYQAYEDLKNKLEDKGWFADENKKPIPSMPQKIGVITSPTGAAIRDILITIKRRFPTMEVLLFPVLVQGESASSSIAEAIKMAQMEDGIDLLIVGRGGGSIEELWAFNEEIVARAIFQSSIPIISAVGHETDFTIADFVADLRAATPTAAAELAAPNLEEVQNRIRQVEGRLKRALLHQLKDRRKQLTQLKSRYGFKYINQLKEQKEQELDSLMTSLQRSIVRQMEKKQTQLGQARKQLLRINPQKKLIEAGERQTKLVDRMKRAMNLQIERKQQSLHYKLATLDALSPLKIMTKGFSLVYNEDKTMLYKSVHEVEPGQTVKISMNDGELDCQVWGIKEENRNE
jgi:exodeoxyribonuclease VII large subunit